MKEQTANQLANADRLLSQASQILPKTHNGVDRQFHKLAGANVD